MSRYSKELNFHEISIKKFKISNKEELKFSNLGNSITFKIKIWNKFSLEEEGIKKIYSPTSRKSSKFHANERKL